MSSTNSNMDQRTMVQDSLITAVRAELSARMAANRAHILNLVYNATGIGEHTKLVEDILGHLSAYTAAQDELETLDGVLGVEVDRLAELSQMLETTAQVAESIGQVDTAGRIRSLNSLFVKD